MSLRTTVGSHCHRPKLNDDRRVWDWKGNSGAGIHTEECDKNDVRHSIVQIPLPTSFYANTARQSAFVIESTPRFDDTVRLTKSGTKDAE